MVRPVHVIIGIVIIIVIVTTFFVLTQMTGIQTEEQAMRTESDLSEDIQGIVGDIGELEQIAEEVESISSNIL